VVNTAFGFLLFNLLFSSMGSLSANAVSTAGGTATSFVLNRHITYRHRPRRSLRQELPLFVGVNLVGLGLQQGVMALAKVTFNLQNTDRLEFNLVRVVSVVIGTVFLLLCYRYLVFRKDKPEMAEDIAIEIGVRLAPLPAGPTRDGAEAAAETHVQTHGGSYVENGGRHNAAEPSAAEPTRPPLAPATASHNGGRHRTVSPGTFHELTVPLEVGRPNELTLSPELELDELLPIESAPDASAHFRL
jgi:putative flippase GtrA